MSDKLSPSAPPALPRKIRFDEDFLSRALRQFYDAYEHPNFLEAEPMDLTSEVGKEELRFRFLLIGEEFAELCNAIFGKAGTRLLELTIDEVAKREAAEMKVDPVEVIDALGDMLYLIVGAFVALGVPFEKVLREIHASNMSKLWADGKPVKREDGKVMKGENFCPPNLAPFLTGGSTPNSEAWVEDNE